MSKPVRIGFVGVGNMGQCAHLRNYGSVPGCKVLALAEPRLGLAHEVARRYNVPQVFESAEAMVASLKLDALVAPQPFDRHGQLVAPLYQFGLPILTEKPLAASVAVGEAMLSSLGEGGSWHMVGYHKRSDPATMLAKAEIDRLKQTGELGAMRYVRLTMPAGDWIAGGFNDLVSSEERPPHIDADPPAADMNAQTYAQYVSFVNFYIHQVNLMRHLLGCRYRVTYADPSGVLMAVQSEEGVAGALEMTPYQTTLDWRESALVGFERGYVKLELPAPLAHNRPGRAEFFRDPGNGKAPETAVPQLPWVHAMRQQAINYVSAIKGEIEPMCEAAEALEDLRMARDYIRLWKGV